MADSTLPVERIDGGCPCGFWAVRNCARAQAQGLCAEAEVARVRAETAERIAQAIEARPTWGSLSLAALARDHAQEPTDRRPAKQAGHTYLDVLRSTTADPDLLAAADRVEAQLTDKEPTDG